MCYFCQLSINQNCLKKPKTQLQLNFLGKAFFKRFVCFPSIAWIRISGLSFSAWHLRGHGQTAVLGWVIATLGFSVCFYLHVYIISVFLWSCSENKAVCLETPVLWHPISQGRTGKARKAALPAAGFTGTLKVPAAPRPLAHAPDVSGKGTDWHQSETETISLERFLLLFVAMDSDGPRDDSRISMVTVIVGVMT